MRRWDCKANIYLDGEPSPEFVRTRSNIMLNLKRFPHEIFDNGHHP